MTAFYCMYYAVITGWETNNKYRVLNSLGQQVYFATEGEITLQISDSSLLGSILFYSCNSIYSANSQIN